MVHRGGDRRRMDVLRLWAAPVVLQPGDLKTWMGTAQELRFTEQLDFVSYWQAQPIDEALLEDVRDAAAGLQAELSIRDADGRRVLRLRAPPPL